MQHGSDAGDDRGVPVSGGGAMGRTLQVAGRKVSKMCRSWTGVGAGFPCELEVFMSRAAEVAMPARLY
jgi:hypothetical protein